MFIKHSNSNSNNKCWLCYQKGYNLSIMARKQVRNSFSPLSFFNMNLRLEFTLQINRRVANRQSIDKSDLIHSNFSLEVKLASRGCSLIYLQSRERTTRRRARRFILSEDSLGEAVEHKRWWLRTSRCKSCRRN